MRLAHLAPPGAGKGTLSKYLFEEFGLTPISTGDILREMKDERASDGRTIGEIMSAGELVPDNNMALIMKKHPVIASGRYQLDGFPRTVAQAEIAPLDLVIHHDISYDECAKRLAGRRYCVPCKKAYGLHNMPDSGMCDIGHVLVAREDDTDAAIARRLADYGRHTAPLVYYFRSRGKLVTVKIEPSWSPQRAYEEIRKPVVYAINGPGEI